jgi:hypothetical protein
MIKNKKGKYYLYSQDGSKKLGGPYNTRSAATARERQVTYFKNQSNYIGIRAQIGGSFRTEAFNGREYTVVPVVALVEGVLQGVTAEAPELALAEEFGRFPAGWNGRPVVMDHPEIVVDNVAYKVSANSPAILEKYQFGFMFNSKMDGTRLLTEAWIDNERAGALNTDSQRVLERLKANETIEISTGLFTGVLEHSGRFNNEDYAGIWKGVVPDHLAFLPEGATGACSVADGCGAARQNQASYEVLRANCGTNVDCGCNMAQAQPVRLAAHAPAKKKKPGDPGYVAPAAPPVANPSTSDVMTNEKAVTSLADYLGTLVSANLGAPDGLMDSDVRSLLSAAVSALYPNDFSYVVGFTNKTCVYMAWDDDDGTYCYFQCSYSIDDNKTVTFGNDMQEVILTTQITPVTEADEDGADADLSAQAGNPGASAPTTETVMSTPATPGTPASAATITAAQARTYLADFGHDAAALTAMTDENVLKLHTKVTTKVTALAAPATPAVTAPAVVPATAEQPKVQTTAEYLQAAPAEIRESMESAMRLQKAHKDRLIKALQDTKRCKFTVEQLAAMPVDQLENLASLADVPAPADYSGLNTNSQPRDNANSFSGFAPEPPKLVVSNPPAAAAA